MLDSASAATHVSMVKNALVQDGEGFVKRNVMIEGGVISSICSIDDDCEDAGSQDGAVIDAEGKYLLPGLIDLHFHGAVGCDLCDGTTDAIDSIARYEAMSGITTICPATMTYPQDKLAEVMRAANRYRDREFEGDSSGASLVGINMEGPFISPDKVGAQNPSYVRCPDYDQFSELQEISGGLIKIVDIAPESDGAIEFTKLVTKDGTVVSLAHTVATYDEALALFDAGATHVTHLFNAMPGINHREPGPIIAASETRKVSCEIICDGIHIHPATVRFAFDLFGWERMILISDSMRATGMADGTYDLGGQDVHKVGNKATLADGTIAGSVSNLYDCFKWAVNEAGIPLASAIRCASLNPSKALGISDEVGSVEVGKRADLLIAGTDLELQSVILGGKAIS